MTTDDKPLSEKKKELFRDIASLIAIYKFSNNGTAEQTTQKVLNLIIKQENQASFQKILERIEALKSYHYASLKEGRDEMDDNTEYLNNFDKGAISGLTIAMEIIKAELGEVEK
jgi:hypothetical protein